MQPSLGMFIPQRNTAAISRHLEPKVSRTRVNVIKAIGFGGFGKQTLGSTVQSGRCPCGSKLKPDECCDRFLDNKETPLTAEELMRSRYVAYKKGDVGYIVRTTHPKNELVLAKTLEADTRASCNKVSYDGLKILLLEPGENHEDEAFVTFEVTFKVKGQQGQRAHGSSIFSQTMKEKSKFLREGDTWLYLSSECP